MATLARYQAFALDDAGNVLASPTVEVRDENSGALVGLFSDRAGASGISNPFTGNSDGSFGFHVAGGVYKITVTSGSVSRILRYVGISTGSEVDFDNSAWTAFTPTVGSASGTFTTVAGSGRYKQRGKLVFFHLSIVITTNGSAAGYVSFTLPVTAFSSTTVYTFSGRGTAVSGKQLQGCNINATSAFVQNFDGTYPGANGETLICSGVYEAA